METIGYKIQDSIATTRNSELFLATHPQYSEALVCKKNQAAYASNQVIEHLRHELELLNRFDHPSIIKAHGIESVQGQSYLVRDYFDGVALHDVLKDRPLELERFLPLAIQLADVIETLHLQEVIHGNLSPYNILIDRSGEQLMLTGFGAAVRRLFALEEEGCSESSQSHHYLAPEQGGRLCYQVGPEADIYSLGILFFQMLSGQLPFDSQDTVGLIHSHIAKHAPMLDGIVDGVPKGVAEMVAKMIEKTPGDRYSSVASLKADLKRFFVALQTGKEIVDFEPDGMGGTLRFKQSNKLYGRTNEIRRFKETIRSQSQKGRASLISIYGSSGVGKSSMVEATIEELESFSGYHLSTKFDQYRQNTPFEMLYSALRDLIDQVLAGDEDRLKFWKKRLQDSLGRQAGVLVEAIPEVAWIIGAQPEVETLPPSDAKVRLNGLLCRFVQAFATSEHPLILVLDDLQWADISTIEWLETALQDISHLVIVAVYRDNEVEAEHPFNLLLNKVRNSQADSEEIRLSDISSEAIGQLVADYLPLPDNELTEVSEIILQKTGGNAFFVNEYLKQLHQDKVVFFDPDESSWSCDLDKLKQLPVSDNVVDFLSQRIVTFPEQVKSLLKIASCIGNRFNAGVARSVHAGFDVGEDFEVSLETAINEGWVKPELGGSDTGDMYYQFTHDRIQQAVWSLLEPEEREHVHLLIGRHMQAAHAQLEKEVLFDCVNHLNKACGLFTSQEEWWDLAELNYQASLEAKSSGDFELALAYIKKAMEWMPDLDEHSKLALILKDRAECEHLCNRREQAIHFYNQAVEASEDLLEKAYVFELMIKFYTDISEFEQAYSIGRSATQMFGVGLPSKFNPALFAKDFLSLQAKLRKYEVSELLDLPEVQDEHMRMVIRLLSAILKAAYQIKPELCVAISLKVIRLCLKYGNSREAVVGYIVFGIIFQGGVLGKHKIGYEYGKLSMALVERYGNTQQKAEVQFVFGYFAMSWQKASAFTEQNWFDAYRHGLEVGDWFHTGCAAAGIVQSMFMRGKPLDEIIGEVERFESSLQRIGAEEQLGAILSVKQAIHNLRGETHSSLSFDHADFDEGDYVDSLDGYGSRHFAHYYYVNKMWTLYLHREYRNALEISLQSRKFLGDSKGMLHGAEHYFLTALVQAQLYSQSAPFKRQQYRLNIAATVKRFTAWAESCPENFLVRLRILEGEKSRLAGNYPQALRSYEAAIEAAGVFGQPHLNGVANSLAADVHEMMHQSKVAGLYRQAAKESFQRWGASVGQEGENENRSAETSIFDVSALMKATEVIAREKRLPELLETLIGIMVENAGAQHGLLLLQENDLLVVQAEALVETDSVSVMQGTPYLQNPNMVHSIVNYVLRTEEAIVLENAQQSSVFGRDEEVDRRGVKSVLCAPLILHGQFRGVIYLENNAVSGVFTTERIELLKHLSGHVVIAIDNAVIYDQLEQKVAERTHDIDVKNEALGLQNVELKKQNDTILELNSLVVKENEERIKVEKQLQQAIEELNRLATTDSLTELSNRRDFDRYLEQECDLQARSDKPLSLLLCDIDSFKAYNDHYGHQQGDACLKQVADILNESVLRSTDFVARYGGEEFALVLPSTNEEGALRIAQTIHEKLREVAILHEYSSVSDSVTLSIGLAVAPEKERAVPQVLLKMADDALYRAKKQGRNRTVSS
ncbi:diguanylate cyclase [Thiomicrorhabdus sp. ZW0627]|uniref:diguanylate cyclase domain-containing protein n=1 Tax=Thiomicrorhabdus sp. ZW0627 TaxID=3039774 RepID=UPI0024367FFC|nr:diguanylate cyclase [Thiomicrorhabdus sp. ZW0627]MDG6774653.1 diguanylate cyclase [Thiomicrorhabdus sp. ZW0627]